MRILQYLIALIILVPTVFGRHKHKRARSFKSAVKHKNFKSFQPTVQEPPPDIQPPTEDDENYQTASAARGPMTPPSDPEEQKAPDKGGVVMNIYEGQPPEESEDNVVAAAVPEETKEEIGKMTGAVSRMETEEGEGAKHDADLEEMNAKHAENQENVSTSKIINVLDNETKQLKGETKKEEDVETNEEKEHEASMNEIDTEEQTDESKTRAKEGNLERKAHSIEKDMTKQEELIKEDEDEIKQTGTKTKEKMTDIQSDEEAKLAKIKDVAALRGKELKDVTFEDCAGLVGKQAERAKTPQCEEEKIKQETQKIASAEEPCESNGSSKQEPEKSESPTFKQLSRRSSRSRHHKAKLRSLTGAKEAVRIKHGQLSKKHRGKQIHRHRRYEL